MNLDEKDTLTGRPLHELEMFSLRPGMYGSTRVFLSSVCSKSSMKIFATTWQRQTGGVSRTSQWTTRKDPGAQLNSTWTTLISN